MDRSAGALTLWAKEPGPLLFRLSSEDPGTAPGWSAVSSRFVGSGEGPLEVLAARGGEDEEEIEINAITQPGDA
ncbi:MAG: hypothetical protein KDD47_01380, partial [Acidobacteria bacterium]|nr:hypothetical protein [Acidobacteriota bacterium]